MSYIKGENGTNIHKLMSRSNKEFNNKNYETSIVLLEEAWQKVEGNKISYSESFLIVARILDISIVIKDTLRMKKWVDKIFEVDPERSDLAERAFIAGKIYYELGELQTAKKYFHIAAERSNIMNLGNGREDKKYLSFYEIESLKEHKTSKLLKFIMDNYSEDDELIYGINELLNLSTFIEINKLAIIYLFEMLTFVKKSSHRAFLIETIVKIEEFEFQNNKELLDEYIILLSHKATTNKNAAKCLEYFIFCGADSKEIFDKLVAMLDKNDVFEIFVIMNSYLYHIKYGHAAIDKDLINKQKYLERIIRRSAEIARFFFIVHPLCFKYGSISTFSFYYSSPVIAIEDWAFCKTDSAKHLVSGKIFNKNEAEILERLGSLIISDVNLNSEEIKSLYYEFLNGRDAFDVIFNLPE